MRHTSTSTPTWISARYGTSEYGMGRITVARNGRREATLASLIFGNKHRSWRGVTVPPGNNAPCRRGIGGEANPASFSVNHICYRLTTVRLRPPVSGGVRP
jgi:hypothetical protein